MSTPEPLSLATSKVPAGCWVDQHDWSIWPLDDYACSPNEWPYNLEAPRGTREFCKIIAWFLRNHPQVHEPDIGECLALIEECAPANTLTARVTFDPEWATYTLCLTLYECKMEGRLKSKELDLYWRAERDRPHLQELRQHLHLWHKPQRFPGLDRLSRSEAHGQVQV